MQGAASALPKVLICQKSGQIPENLRKIPENLYKIPKNLGKISKNPGKMVPNVMYLQKLAPNICRKTSHTKSSHQTKVFMIFVGENV